jgi:non-ribosomal peptide synthetase component E (peptide arylation enzyme)
VFKLIIKNEAMLRKDHMKLLTMPIRSKADVSAVTSTIEARILIAMIVNQKTKESIDRELTQSFMSTVAVLENVSERSRQAIKELQKILESKHSRDSPYPAYLFLLSLADYFDEKEIPDTRSYQPDG